ncbi:MAG: transposase [Candidatus Niyogibacteria bacterium]|nr:transposase [Candidatus Niyogibacteria bacterium]
MRLVPFIEGEYYHVFNRGVDKKIIFTDDSDRLRFILSLYGLNDDSGRPMRFDRLPDKSLALVSRDGDVLVEIVAWCLMPTHFHLLLKEAQKGGISTFLHRLQTSYALYFNTKYNRTGSLFGGTFKAILSADDVQFTHASRYVHLNSLELFDPMWKERGYVEDKLGAEKFLKEYKWSSLPDYLGHKTGLSSIVDNKPIMEYFDNNIEDYWKFITDWSELSSCQS